MGKNVYSLVLTDEVVQAVDELAYANNVSRSHLINQILADALSLTTQETRLQRLYESVARLFEQERVFQVQTQPTDAVFSIRSALRYKYNPTIRYSVAFTRQEDGAFWGDWKAVCRTQSEPLLLLLNRFFQVMADAERPCQQHKRVSYQVGERRFCKLFALPKETSVSGKEADAVLAQSLADYIRLFDAAIKEYFRAPGEENVLREKIRGSYRQYQGKYGLWAL